MIRHFLHFSKFTHLYGEFRKTREKISKFLGKNKNLWKFAISDIPKILNIFEISDNKADISKYVLFVWFGAGKIIYRFM